MFSPLGWSVECPKGSYFVHGHSRRSYIRADGTYVHATEVKSHCRVKSSAYEFLKPRLSTTRPPKWPHQKERLSKWKSDEVERVLDALEDLPEELLMQSIEGFHHLDKSIFEGNSADLKTRKYYWKGRETAYVAEDGKNSPTEDFANNVEFYLFDPAKLKKETPKVDKWIRERFGDKFKIKGVSQ